MKLSINICIATLFLSLVGTFSLSAQRMIVTTTDGNVIKYKVSELKNVVFEPKKEFDPTNLLSEEYIPCEGFRD